MATSTQTLPEHWTELSASKTQRARCSEDVEELKRACEKDCGKRHVVECESCYGKVLDRMKQRYVESQEREWFSQRRAFLQELEDLFADAKNDQRSLKTIEARIESEKEAWYRWVLRKYPEFLEVADHGMLQDDLRGMLDDPDQSRDQLVSMMWQGVGKPQDWSPKVDAFADKVAAAKGDATELKKLYISEFFTNGAEGGVLTHAQKYLDEYRSNDDTTLEEIMGKIAQDNHRSRSSQPQRDHHMKRLDELRRAKTAFEQNKLRSKGLLHQVQAKDELYDLPACTTCKGPVSPSDVLSCSLCQAIMQMGGVGKLTVYCSEKCFRDGHEEHVSKDHDCDAGDKCVQLTDEDVEMGNGEHRKLAHDGAAGSDDASIISLGQAVHETLEKENPNLKMAQMS
ncbi:hypothetical protein K4F52_004250 [Lecanicillium sp. MT-2017a]|nr:hypothetical protein K4F52_004250 [Lecanicillium sp. MT-2017a]